MIDKYFRTIIINIGWFYEAARWRLIKPLIRRQANIRPAFGMSIGITTFMDRYNTCLRPLVNKLSILFPNDQIVVIANGHVKGEKQKKYLSRISRYCMRYPNVELISYLEAKGLSHLWNIIMERTKSKRVLILNDDIRIKASLSGFLERSGILKNDIATINSSWSQFIISKDLYERIGLFDEGLKEIGGEDDDYAARLAIKGINIANYVTRTIAAKLRRKNKLMTCNSYGKNMLLEAYGYSNVNSEYLFEKWETSMEYFSGAIMVPNRKWRYWKLREK